MADDNGPRSADRSRRGRRGEREPATIELRPERVVDEPVTPPPAEPPLRGADAQESLAQESVAQESVAQESIAQESVAQESVGPLSAPAEPVPAEATATEPVPAVHLASDGESVAATRTTSQAFGIPTVGPAASEVSASEATGSEKPADDLTVDQPHGALGKAEENTADQATSAAEPAPAPGPQPEPEPVPVAAVEAPVEPTPVPPPRAPKPDRGLPLAMGLIGGLAGGAITVTLLAFLGPLADAPDRLTALEAAVGDKATRRTVDALEKRVATAEGSAQALKSDIDAVARRPQVAPGDLTGLAQRIDRLDRVIAQIPAPNADPAAPPPPPPPIVVAGKESAALAVAMLVRDAVTRGTPYGREIAALEQAGLLPDAVAKLKPFAASGAPSAASLANAFAPLATALTTPPEPAPNASIADKAQALFARVVKVRPVGNASGDDPAALAARTDTALRRGDLAAALAALERLPPPDKARVQPFIDRLAARIAAGQAADSLVAAAVDQVIAATANAGVPAR